MDRLRFTDVLFGSIVILVTGVTGLGAALGGWLAGRSARSPGRVALAGGIAGVVGAVPWVVLAYLASAGAIDPVGYHEGLVHVGVNPADPATLARWQELLLSALVGAIVVSAPIGGGLLASGSAVLSGELRAEASNAE